ncbi:MAG TPA: hypothetical protein VHC90_10480 [Bryobacteraceae bacterium]|nr:hypothetical protein [Bryobacteraceae bacterium]
MSAPISPARLAANRQNAKKSTGPKTKDGKARSSQNARRHGQTAQITVMTDEDRVAHDHFTQAMIAELAPVGPVETFHAASAAEEAWRLHNGRAQCNNIVAIGHFDGTGDLYEAQHPEIHAAITAATVTRDRAKTLELLSLYEQRILRSFRQHFDQLQKLQAERKSRREAELNEARLLRQLAQTQNLSYEPAADGFVFSNDDITRFTDRRHRVRLAVQTEFHPQPTPKPRDFPQAA